jgi:hypothetical protein
MVSGGGRHIWSSEETKQNHKERRYGGKNVGKLRTKHEQRRVTTNLMELRATKKTLLKQKHDHCRREGR